MKTAWINWWVLNFQTNASILSTLKEKKTVMSVSYSAQLRERIILISWHGSDIVEYVLICCWCYLAFQRMSFDSNVILKDRSHPWIAMRFHFFLSLCVVVDRTKLCAVWKNQNVTLFKWEFRLCKMKRPLCLNVVRLSSFASSTFFSLLFFIHYIV